MPPDEPAAPAVTPTTPTVEPVTETPFSTLAEDDQIVEALRAEGFAKRDEAEQQPPAKPGVAKAGAKPASSAPKFATADAAILAIVAAFEKNDVEALAAATGKPKAFFEINDAKWTAFRARETAARELSAQTTADLARLAKGREQANAEFGTAIRAAKAYQEGDFEQFAVLVSELSGDDYATAQRNVIEGALAVDPKVKAERKRAMDAERRLAALEAERAKPPEPAKPAEATPAERQAAYGRVVAAIDVELTGHPLSKVKGFQKLVLEKIRESHDGKTYTMGYTEAADAIVEDRRSEAQTLNLTPAAKPAARPKPAQPSAPPRGRAADARVPDGEPWLTSDVDDDEIIASIERDRKAGRLK